MRVLLVCSNGISSSLVVSRMKQYASLAQVPMQVDAENEDNLPYVYHAYEIVLVAPQLAHHYEAIVNQYAGSGIAFGMIPMKDYGLANGEALVKYAQNIYEQTFKNGQYTFENELLGIIANAGKIKELVFSLWDDVDKGINVHFENKLKKAHHLLIQSHQIQAQMIAHLMDGGQVNVLMVHAQDQLANAETILELSQRMLRHLEKR